VRADAAPLDSPPILRLSRLSSDLALNRQLMPSAPDMVDTLLDVQRELAAIDTAIADRYFAGAHRPALNSPARPHA
jgi:hypothetical protein